MGASTGSSVDITTLSAKGVNMIFLATAWPTGNTGTLEFYSLYSNLVNNVATVRSQGVKVVLMLGGAGGNMYNVGGLSASSAYCTNVANSVKSIINGAVGPIDGINFNTFENNAGFNSGQIACMVATAKLLRSWYPGFLIVIPPVGASGMASQVQNDIRIGQGLYNAGVLNYVFPQFYGGPGQNVLSNVQSVLNSWTSVGIPASILGLGMAWNDPADSATAPVSTLWNIWTGATPSNGYAGVALWEIGLDSGFQFVTKFSQM
ncbi:UNVERIFIED_CONTAM: hypothetical protein HDU68_006780 [Siphonaria sp. JEL0065]|nr:hypothetical protein HDU68_006780 [Siphonaria sp. JEL0065]